MLDKTKGTIQRQGQLGAQDTVRRQTKEKHKQKTKMKSNTNPTKFQR